MRHITIIADGYEQLGRFIFNNRWKVVILSCLFNGLLGLGLLSLVLNNDIEDLYLNKDTETQRLTDKLDDIFPDQSGTDFKPRSTIKYPLFVEVIVFGKEQENLLHPVFLNESKWLIDDIRRLTSTSDYLSQISYYNVCARNAGLCYTSGTEILLEVGDCENEHACAVYLKALKENYTKERFADILQNIGNYTVQNSTVRDARFLKFRFYLRQETPGRSTDSRRWMREVLKYLDKLQSERIDIVYSHSESFYEELGDDTYPDIPYFALTFTILLTYFGFLISGGDCVSKRVNIGRMGSLVAPLSVLGSWGLIVGSGVEFTNITGVMPYIAVFYEVNNMLVTLSAVSDLSDKVKAEDRTAIAVRRAGIPITMTTVTHIATFLAGISSNFMALRLFSIFTVGTLLFVYMNHMVFFTACLAIHEQRIDGNRHFCSCNTLQTKEVEKDNHRSCCFLCCCTGGRTANRDGTASQMEKITRKLLTRFILQSCVRWTGILVFLGYLGVSIWQMTYFKVELIKKTSVTTDSYFSKFHSVNSRRFTSDFYLNFVLPGRLDYTAQQTTDFLSNVEKKLIHNKNIDPSSSISWYTTYKSSRYCNISSEAAFKSSLQEFLQSNPTFANDLMFDENGRITVSRFYFKTRNIQAYEDSIGLKESLLDLKVLSDNDKDLAKGMLKMYKKGNGVTSEGHDGEERNVNEDDYEENDTFEDAIIVHSPGFIYTDKHASPLKESTLIIGIQVAVSSVLLTITCPHPLSFVQALFWYASVWIGVFGFLAFLEVSMDAVAMIMIVLSSCYVAEVISHTLISFFYTYGMDRRSRATEVLDTTSVILFNTTLGSFIGLLVLLVEKSYVFITVFKILCVSTAVCFLHSFLFIPVGLSVFGPSSSCCLSKESNTSKCRSINVPEIFASSMDVIHSDVNGDGVDNKAFKDDEKF